MRWTTGSFSALARGLPLDPVAVLGVLACGIAPGSTCNFAGRPNAPLAAAITIFLPSALTDISISAAEAATLIVRSLPSIFHSPVASMDESMLRPEESTAFSTALRTSSMLRAVDFGSGCLFSGGGSVTTAGAADPITTCGLVTSIGAGRGLCGSGADAIRGGPFRAESAANGETNGRAAAGGSFGFLGSDRISGFGSGANDNLRSGAFAFGASTPLNNCSIGNRRWA